MLNGSELLFAADEENETGSKKQFFCWSHNKFLSLDSTQHDWKHPLTQQSFFSITLNMSQFKSIIRYPLQQWNHCTVTVPSPRRV